MVQTVFHTLNSIKGVAKLLSFFFELYLRIAENVQVME